MKLSKMILIVLAVIWGFIGLAAQERAIEFNALFTGCSYYLKFAKGTGTGKVTVNYRCKGEAAWFEGVAPITDNVRCEWRGSVFNLKEDSCYELKLMQAGKVIAVGSFITLNSDVPIAGTVDISQLKAPIKISAKGKPDGWIRYTAPVGYVINGDGAMSGSGIEIVNAEYVILEGIILKGGRKHGINMLKSRHVRIANCDISGWGRVGKRIHDTEFYCNPNGTLVHGDCGIYLSSSSNIVIERCFIHDPRSNSSSWQYGHPIGAYAVRCRELSGTVIRNNDFIGSDLRRWCDTIGSDGNFSEKGGFVRDAEIYGNYLAFAHDDGIELDGSEINMRVFANRIEGGFCGISTTPCIHGPTYVFKNLFSSFGDADGLSGSAIKDLKSLGGAVYYVNNTIIWPGVGIKVQSDFRAIYNNVISSTRQPITVLQPEKNPNKERIAGNIFWSARDHLRNKAGNANVWAEPDFVNAASGDYALQYDFAPANKAVNVTGFSSEKVYAGAIIPGSTHSVMKRNTGFSVSDKILTFSLEKIKLDKTLRHIEVKAMTAIGKLKIQMSESCSWLDVTPAEFELEKGGSQTLTVRIKRDAFTRSGLHCGAFRVRRTDGLSLPISVYAINGGKTPLAIFPKTAVEVPVDSVEENYSDKLTTRDGEKALLIAPQCIATYKFNLPQTGKYYIMLKIYSDYPCIEHNDFSCSIDDGKWYKFRRKLPDDRWFWTGLSNPEVLKRFWTGNYLRLYELSAGEHTLKFKGEDSVLIGRIVITPEIELTTGNAGKFKF